MSYSFLFSLKYTLFVSELKIISEKGNDRFNVLYAADLDVHPIIFIMCNGSKKTMSKLIKRQEQKIWTLMN